MKPGEGFNTAFAIGLADTGASGAIPATPLITDHDWSVWRQYLQEGNPPPKYAAVEFAAERVDIYLTQEQMRLRGVYIVRNRDHNAATIGIVYPISVSSDRPAPDYILVDGKTMPIKTDKAGSARAHFSIQTPALGVTSFQVEYTQRNAQRHAVYIVTSALRWPSHMTRAVFTIRYPESLRKVSISYPVKNARRANGEVEQMLVFQPFIPDRELEIRWK